MQSALSERNEPARCAPQAYDSMQLDDEHVFTCVGTSGPSAPPVPPRLQKPKQIQVENGKVSGGPSQVRDHRHCCSSARMRPLPCP